MTMSRSTPLVIAGLAVTLLTAGLALGQPQTVPASHPTPECSMPTDAKVEAIAHAEDGSAGGTGGAVGCAGDGLRAVVTWAAGEPGACPSQRPSITVGQPARRLCPGGYCGPIGLTSLPNTCETTELVALGSDGCVTVLATVSLVLGPIVTDQAQLWVDLEQDQATACDGS